MFDVSLFAHSRIPKCCYQAWSDWTWEEQQLSAIPRSSIPPALRPETLVPDGSEERRMRNGIKKGGGEVVKKKGDKKKKSERRGGEKEKWERGKRKTKMEE